MYRRLQTVAHKNANAMLSAGEKLTFGMFVEADHAKKQAKKPEAGSKNVFLVEKERQVDGKDNVEGMRSDYDELFENIKEGEMVVLETLLPGEFYAVNQIVHEGLKANDKLKVNADGKLEKDASGDDAIAIYVEKYDDAGHELHAIQIIK